MGCLLLLFRILLCFHLLLFHFPSFSSSISNSSAPLCYPDQSSALLQFKNSFHLNITEASGECDQPYPKTITWENGTDCCSWMGVTCDSVSGHVIGLDLNCSGLYGNFHPNSTLFRLTHLQRLNLAHNHFNQSQLPSQLGGLVSLTHLNLSYSVFKGDIPSQISHLSKLASLDLSLNHDLKLKETTWKRFVHNATLLREIILDRINLSSLGPNPLSLLSKWSSSLVTISLSSAGIRGQLTSDILCLPNLQELYLSENDEIQLHLPMLNCSASLRTLDLSECSLQGPFPPSFANLTHLTSLILSSNLLNSSIPSSFSNLPQHLTHLDLSSNYLNSSIPSSFSNLPQHLTHLDLSSNHLNSSVPSSLSNLQHLTHLDLSSNELSGSIPSSLSNLQHLTHFYLSSNEFSGSILSSLSNFQHLTHLDLSSNKLSSIPSRLLNLQNLTHLDLSSNELTGSIPTSISDLRHLMLLDLSYNQLSGQIPDVLGGLTKLQTLSLNGNNLGGQLPSSLFTLTQLSFLDCSFNKFEGGLPNKIIGFSYLTELYLNDNLLNGTIPSWCLSLPSLTSLYLTNNRFTGHIGAISSYSLLNLDLCGNKLLGYIPESFFNLVNLTSLCMSSHNYDSPIHFPLFSKLQNLEFLSLSGYLSLKSDINANYSFSNLIEMHLLSNNLIDDPRFSGNFPKLRYLELSNSLQGKVPKWIHDMDSLSILILPHNLLTSLDQFPLHNLLYLDLSSNLMTGDISSFICNATSLLIVDLSDNKFTGTFPQCLTNFSHLRVLDLQMNKVHGTLPNTFSTNKDLEELNIYGNQLEGLLPKSLSNCTELTDLNLGNNQLEDTFPHWLKKLPYLEILVLRANKLYGPITSLETKHLFPYLIIFDISCNSFSGPLPKAYIQNFQAMKIVVQPEEQSTWNYIDFYLGYVYGGTDPGYDASVTATIKGVSTTFMKIPTVFVFIDLSDNKFEGEIPNVIGKLHALKGLNLSHNRLTGHIPHSMGNLTNLESLDLSSNMLIGGIPIELTNLNSLEVLNLSHNHLVGEIPRGKQFNTFPNDSYEGNMGLCGFPLSVQCDKDHEKQSPSLPTFEAEEKFGFGWKPVAIGYGCGMVLGVGIGCFVLSIGKPQWLVRMVGGDPNKRVTSRRGTRTRGSRARIN